MVLSLKRATWRTECRTFLSPMEHVSYSRQNGVDKYIIVAGCSGAFPGPESTFYATFYGPQQVTPGS